MDTIRQLLLGVLAGDVDMGTGVLNTTFTCRKLPRRQMVADRPRKVSGCCCIDKGQAGPFWDHAKYKKTTTLIGRSQWWARIM